MCDYVSTGYPKIIYGTKRYKENLPCPLCKDKAEAEKKSHNLHCRTQRTSGASLNNKSPSSMARLAKTPLPFPSPASALTSIVLDASSTTLFTKRQW